MSALDKHIAAIRSGNVNRTNVIGIRKALNANARRAMGYSTGSTASKATQAECELVQELLADFRPLVIGTLDTTGKELLAKKRYRKQLASVAEIVADVQGFHLVGFDCDESGHHTPVYRAFNSEGQSFPFSNKPWQAGGNGPQIMSANYY